jgi:hypothetical protein
MSISIVVSGFDKYSKLWPGLVHGFKKYWPDCPWPKYFITNYMDAPPGFKTIKTAKEFSWGSKATRALLQIDTDIVFWLMEDCWLPGPVDTTSMVKFYDLMMANPIIDHIRMVPPFLSDGTIVPERECDRPSKYDPRLWHFKEAAEWRASIMAPFWRRESLLGYLREGDSVWSFEDQASIFSIKSAKEHLCVIDPYVFPFPHKTNPYQRVKDELMTKGEWTKAAYDYCKVEGLTMNFSMHPNGMFNKEVG